MNSRKLLKTLSMLNPRQTNRRIRLQVILTSTVMTIMACVFRCTNLGHPLWYTALKGLKAVSGAHLTKGPCGSKLLPGNQPLLKSRSLKTNTETTMPRLAKTSLISQKGTWHQWLLVVLT
jgi:hypothetical protein